MEKKTFIYALRDPRTKEVFYVGKADAPKKRLFNHLHTAKGFYDIPPLYVLLKQLIDEQLKPDLLILDEVENSKWEDKEKEYIEFYKNRGDELLNKTVGGKGFSEDMKRRSAETNSKPILQYDLQGSFIREWQSIRFAARELKCAKSTIYASLNTKQKTAQSFYWRYKIDDKIPENIALHPKKTTNKPIFQILDNGEKVRWPSIRLAAKGLNIHEGSISHSIGTGGTCYGYKFEKDFSDRRWQKPYGKLNQELINYNYVDV